MIVAAQQVMQKLKLDLRSLMKTIWGECLGAMVDGKTSEWVRFLGREMQRTSMGFRVCISENYVNTLPALLHLEKRRAAPTPFLTTKPEKDSPACDATEHHLYRRVVGKPMWLTGERSDLVYAVKELARRVQGPVLDDMKKLKRVGKYLLGTVHMEWDLNVDENAAQDVVMVTTDTNWAALPDRRSTSGGWVAIGGFPLQHWSRTQAVVTQSTCESELIALNSGATEGKLVQHVLEEIGIAARLVLVTDRSSTRLLVLKRGPGRMRHLEVRQLWLQQELRAGRITVTTVASE